ncbi:MAG TPA: glycosyltransferase family 4 protein [Bacteroidia bacterium]|nr:glycosyltransferase family 4 protein [Bacteroidia bacterium]
MKILYFYQYFSTPKGSWGTRVYEFCREWVKQGHEVTVVTSIYSKSDLKAEKLVEDQYFEGIKVKVLNIYIDNKQGFLKRILSFVNYCLLSCWYALRLKADVVIASSGPITVGLPGLVAKIFGRKKLVFETRDLWPEGAIELGIIKSPVVKKLSLWFEKVCYRKSDYIVCLSPGMVQNIQRRFGYKNIISVTNSADLILFGERKEGPLPEFFLTKKVAIYTGNIGMVNNSYLLLRAAELLKKINRTDIIILLVGDGKQREELQQRAKQAGLDNFVILGLMPKTELVKFIQNSMVSLVPLRGTPVLDTSSPNKLYESLSAGVPVIQNTKGWIKDLLEINSVGYTVDADDERELVEKLIYLADNPAAGKEMGRNARGLAEREFDKKILAEKMLQALVKVHNSGKN